MRRTALSIASIIVLSTGVVAGMAATGNVRAEGQDPQAMMREQMKIMNPALRKQVQGLSPETKKSLLKIYSQHTRHSDRITLRQVMHEVLADYQSVASGIMTDNALQAADAARRLANHRIPRGGLLPYMAEQDVNDDKLGVLVPFNDEVEGNARRLAEAAEKGDMNTAAEYFGKVATGCIGCHQVFRGQPGISSRLEKAE